MIIAVISIAALIMTCLMLFYNNYQAIKKETTIKNKLNILVVCKKSSLVTMLLGFVCCIALGYVSYYKYNNNLEYTLKILFAYELMIPIAYVDYKKMIIPNKLLLVGLVGYIGFTLFEILYRGISYDFVLKYGFYGMLLGMGTFLLSYVFSKGSVGMGDIKLFGVLGLFFGWQGIFNIILFAIIGVVVYGCILLVRKKINKKSAMPMGPFAYIGVAIAIMLGV